MEELNLANASLIIACGIGLNSWGNNYWVFNTGLLIITLFALGTWRLRISTETQKMIREAKLKKIQQEIYYKDRVLKELGIRK